MSALKYDPDLNYHTATIGDFTFRVLPDRRSAGYQWSAYADAIDGGSGWPYATIDAAYFAALTAALQWHAATVHAIAEELRKLEVDAQ